MDVVGIGETMVLFTPHTLGQMRYAGNYFSTYCRGVREGVFLTGKDELGEIAAQFHQYGIETTVIKCGEKGVYYSSLSDNGFVKGFPVEKVADVENTISA